MNLEFILASQSPRRRELIQLLGFPFRVMVADVDEDSVTDPNPAVNVVQTARLKSTRIAEQLVGTSLPAQTLILAADTTVAYAGEMLNKPADEAAARIMLQRLGNREHEVHTGFVLLNPVNGREYQGVSTAVVTMRPYSNEEIDAYIATGDPLDKAGAYAIQHPVFQPVAHLAGCYCNVMGLPVCDLIVALEQFLDLNEASQTRWDLTAVQKAHLHYPCPTLSHLQTRRLV
ncbi:MAG: septum formation protein Maf [Anaerolineaceae bacterium]|nr:septum formation protein Maf [Anaerolineaceae bacterium]